MNRLHARYPFLDEAREAVETADIDLASVVDAEQSPILDRAVTRIEGAIHDGRVPDPIPDPRIELLSYPVARVLISLVDDPVLTDRYALAEARRAFDLLTDEIESETSFQSTQNERITWDALLGEFELLENIHSRQERIFIGVDDYLRLSVELRGEKWRLVNRGLADGMVPVRRPELEELLREGIRQRVAEDLPLDVPTSIATKLDHEVGSIESSLANISIPQNLDVIDPEAFPACIATLFERRFEDEFTPIERFTLVSFLTSIGATPDDLIELFNAESAGTEQLVRYQAEHVHGITRSTAYPPPSCETLQAYGICPAEPPCASTGHPISTYAERVHSGE